MSKIFYSLKHAILIFWNWFTGLFYGIYVLIKNGRNLDNTYYCARSISRNLNQVYGIDLKFASQVDKLPRKAIIIANHQSGFDIPIIGTCIPKHTTVVAKSTLLWIPIFGWLMWIAGNIVINRKVAHQASLTMKYIVNSMNEKNHGIVIFPEGTRSKGRYDMGPFKAGAFTMAIAGEIPIIPLVISDINQHKLSNKSSPVLIKFLEPISTQGLTKKELKELIVSTREKMLQQYLELNQKVADQDYQGFSNSIEFEQY